MREDTYPACSCKVSNPNSVAINVVAVNQDEDGWWSRGWNWEWDVGVSGCPTHEDGEIGTVSTLFQLLIVVLHAEATCVPVHRDELG